MENSSSTITAHKHCCPLCEGMCGLIVSVEHGQVVKIRPDPDNAWSKGHVCPKGLYLGDVYHHGDRLNRPLVKSNGVFREIDWSALEGEVEKRIKPIVEEFGHQSLAAFLGNMSAKGFSLGRYGGRFIELAKIPNIYSSSTNDQYPVNLVCHLLYGNMWQIPIPDIDNTNLMVIFGGNPSASKGSIWSHQDAMKAISSLRKRGGKLIVVDPVKTGTAKKADLWIPIRPGTDAAFLLSVANEIAKAGQVRFGHLDDLILGWENLKPVLCEFESDRIAVFCGVEPDTIKEFAEAIVKAEKASIYGRIGTCTQSFGTLATWAIQLLSIVTGNLDRTGGSMWSTQVAPHQDLTAPYPSDLPVVTGYSRVSQTPSVLGQLPSSCLSEEILTPGKGQIKALVTIGANPVLTSPDSDNLDKALSEIDCLICLDNYVNETTRHADIIIPTRTTFEEPHWDIWAWPFAMKSGGHFSETIFRSDDRPEDWRILTQLGLIIGQHTDSNIDLLDDQFFSSLCRIRKIDPEIPLDVSPEPGPRRILDLAIRTGPFGDNYESDGSGLSLSDFVENPDGLILGHAKPLGASAISTKNGKINLCPDHIMNDIPRLIKALDRDDSDLVLVSRRHLASMNSWMHNIEGLVVGSNQFTLIINTHDAQLRSINDGDSVEISSRSGNVVAKAVLTEDIRQGVVSLPHGWGHDKPDTALSFAHRKPGDNFNRLIGKGDRDIPSGNAVFNGIYVNVTKCQPILQQ